MEYTALEIREKLGGLVNRAQRIRNKIPSEMAKGDARHVALSGIQTSITPLMLAFGALELSNQCIENIELREISGIKGDDVTNEKILADFDTWAKLVLLILIHFRIESLFANILLAMDKNYKRWGFINIATNLFEKLNIKTDNEKFHCLQTLSHLRNSLHSNSIHKKNDFVCRIGTKEFKFIKDEPTSSTIFDIIFLVEYALKIIEEVIQSEKVLAIPSPIQDLFHVKIGMQ